MATAAIAGMTATLEISSDGGASYDKIGECKDITLSVSAEEIDATSMDSGGWKEFIPGLMEWTAETEALYVGADVGQESLYNALTGRTPVKIRFRPKVGTGHDQFTGDAIITSWSVAAPLSDAAASSLSFRGTGVLARVAQ